MTTELTLASFFNAEMTPDVFWDGTVMGSKGNQEDDENVLRAKMDGTLSCSLLFSGRPKVASWLGDGIRQPKIICNRNIEIQYK